jgi:hypothetical protein
MKDLEEQWNNKIQYIWMSGKEKYTVKLKLD